MSSGQLHHDVIVIPLDTPIVNNKSTNFYKTYPSLINSTLDYAENCIILITRKGIQMQNTSLMSKLCGSRWPRADFTCGGFVERANVIVIQFTTSLNSETGWPGIHRKSRTRSIRSLRGGYRRSGRLVLTMESAVMARTCAQCNGGGFCPVRAARNRNALPYRCNRAHRCATIGSMWGGAKRSRCADRRHCHWLLP